MIRVENTYDSTRMETNCYRHDMRDIKFGKCDSSILLLWYQINDALALENDFKLPQIYLNERYLDQSEL